MMSNNCFCTVTEVSGGKYRVRVGEEEKLLVARGGLKNKKVSICVGDTVEISDEAIVEVKERKSFFPRVNVANIDCINIVISSTPAPDFLLVDKMLIECVANGATPYITVNKIDLNSSLVDYVLKNYTNACERIFTVSTLTGDGLEEMRECFRGKIIALAGQSAVGKTSIINELFSLNKRTNDVGKKSKRGRHTTTSRSLHFCGELAVVDTPGFSSVIPSGVKSSEITEYYLDFKDYYGECKYLDCTHSSEPECAVIAACENGELSKDRYDRYLTIYKELKEYEKRRY